jgi:putative oxidoreductase
MHKSTAVHPYTHSDAHEAGHASGLARVVVPVARTLFAAIFLVAAPGHFQGSAVGYAASHGVPFPGILVPLSGLMSIVGALSVILGYRARLGAWLLVAFLLPVTLFMHDFWAVADPMEAALQQGMFLKNASMLGGALLIAHFGAGPVSLDRE